jgi:hypothetical protein
MPFLLLEIIIKQIFVKIAGLFLISSKEVKFIIVAYSFGT